MDLRVDCALEREDSVDCTLGISYGMGWWFPPDADSDAGGGIVLERYWARCVYGFCCLDLATVENGRVVRIVMVKMLKTAVGKVDQEIMVLLIDFIGYSCLFMFVCMFVSLIVLKKIVQKLRILSICD
jgi:hypothetical protein